MVLGFQFLENMGLDLGVEMGSPTHQYSQGPSPGICVHILVTLGSGLGGAAFPRNAAKVAQNRNCCSCWATQLS